MRSAYRDGTIHIEPVRTWISRSGFDAERRTPGSSADAVVWADVTQRAYEESELNWTYLSFMTMATVIASIAIVLDSQILVIGAMVLGPEFVAVAALGLGLVRRRYSLCAARGPDAGPRLRRRDRPHGPRRAGRPGARMGRRRRHHRTTARHGIHLHPGQVVLHRCGHRRSRRRAITDLGEGRRPVRSLHLGHNHPRRRERGTRPGIRRRTRDLGQHSAAHREPQRHGRRRLGDTGFQQRVWAADVVRRARPRRPRPAGDARRRPPRFRAARPPAQRATSSRTEGARHDVVPR